jgi:hypothetical protein
MAWPGSRGVRRTVFQLGISYNVCSIVQRSFNIKHTRIAYVYIWEGKRILHSQTHDIMTTVTHEPFRVT